MTPTTAWLPPEELEPRLPAPQPPPEPVVSDEPAPEPPEDTERA